MEVCEKDKRVEIIHKFLFYKTGKTKIQFMKFGKFSNFNS